MMIRQIMEGRYSFSSAEWSDISQPPRDLISKMLVVDHKQRLTVNLCLAHDFLSPRRWSRRGSVSVAAELQQPPVPQSQSPVCPVSRPSDVPVQFSARRTWRLALTAIQFVVRIKKLKLTPEPLCLKTAATSPYKMRMFRKILDGAAFKVYGHWVKRGEGQNRAAMFELVPKIETVNKEQLKSGMDVN